MFDMSWGEIMVIGGVALIVIGPKDLPKALRTVGQMTTKVRRMAGEFQSQFSEAMREAELEDVRKEVDGLNREVSNATAAAFNPIQTIRDEFKGPAEPRIGGAAGLATAPDAPPASAFDEPAMPDPIVPALPPVAEPAAGPAFPETQPLVPLPVDEPALPSAAPPPGPERVGDAAPDLRT